MSQDEKVVNHERRLEQVEREVNLLTHQATLTTNLVKRLEDQTVKLDSITRGLEVALARKGECPDPGACIVIREEISVLSKRVSTIETERNKFVGMLIVIGVVATSLWGLLSSWLSSLLKP